MSTIKTEDFLEMPIRDILKKLGFAWSASQDAVLHKWLTSTIPVGYDEPELRKAVIKRGSHWKSENGGMDERKCIEEFIEFVRKMDRSKLVAIPLR